jgi:Domain of unknown function (DUF4350)
MPRGLDSADRKLLIGAGVFFVALVAAGAFLSPPQISGAAADPSSYSSAWDGTKAAFLLLQRLGYQVSRWERPPTELPSPQDGDVLILANPNEAQTPTQEERFAVLGFVENGGRLIATGSTASAFLPDSFQFDDGNPYGAPAKFSALVPSPIVRGAPEITMIKPNGWTPNSIRQMELYGDGDTAAVIEYNFGKGQIIWWAAPTPLTNRNLLDSGNLAFVLNCLGSPAAGRIYWDEYFHGVRGSLLQFFVRSPALWGVAQFGLVFLAILATYSRRLGPVRPPVTVSRLSPLEFVDTLGDLYASAKVSAAAVGIAYQRFRFMLTRKLGLPIDTPSPDLARLSADSFGWEEAKLAETLRRCDLVSKYGPERNEEPLELVRRIHDYGERLNIKRAAKQERETE